jgi:D-cysteine desulfhydrase
VIAESLRARGLRPYEIPYGGSNPLGALAFAAAYAELAAQLASASLEASRIVFASSSGGTQAGLMIGKLLSGGSGPALTGICIDKAEEEGADFAERVLAVANGAASLLGLGNGGTRASGPAFGLGDIELERGFTGAGYGTPGELERRATRLLARTEGMLVDPVYTARALGGLISMVESGIIGRGETVVFWHSGGLPALFTSRYSADMIRED